MGYETTSFSAKVLFHPWALHPSVCPTFAEVTRVEKSQDERLVDVLTRQFEVWQREDFASFNPNFSSWTVYVMPALARTLCGLFANLIAAPGGMCYHGAMVCKEILFAKGEERQEKIQAHAKAFCTDGVAFVGTSFAIWMIAASPAMQRNIRFNPLDIGKMLSVWRLEGPHTSLIALTTFVALSVLVTNVPGSRLDRCQDFGDGRQGFRLSQQLHANFGLVDKEGRRLSYSPEDRFFEPGRKFFDTPTGNGLFRLKALLETECLLAAMEAKQYINSFSYKYPIDGNQIADLLPQEQSELALRLKKLQYAISSITELLNSLLGLKEQRLNSKPTIHEDLYQTLFYEGFSAKDTAELRAMGLGSDDWIIKVQRLQKRLEGRNPEHWEALEAFHEQWKAESDKGGSRYFNTYPFAHLGNASERKDLLILFLSRLENPTKFILGLTHSDKNPFFESLGKELLDMLQALKQIEAFIKLQRSFEKLKLEELNTIFDRLDEKYKSSKDIDEKSKLADQMNFLGNCQWKIEENCSLNAFAELLPPFGERWTFDGDYIKTLIGLFDKAQEEGSADLVALLNLAQEEYLASKEERDLAWGENFFLEPWRQELERGRQIFASSEDKNISSFAEGLECALKEKEQCSSKSGDDGRISYAHLFTGIPRGNEVPFETLEARYNDLRASIKGALNSKNLKQTLKEKKAEIILDFYNFVDSRVYEQLEKMQKDEERKSLASSSSVPIPGVD